MEPLVVYTAICGGFLPCIPGPRVPSDPSERPVRYVCFSDGLTAIPRPWELRPLRWEHRNDPRRTARFHKLMSHQLFPEARLTLWHDASHYLLVNPWSLVDRHLPEGLDLATFRHPLRNCLYRELGACIRLDKDDQTVMRRQVTRYLEQGYPLEHGLNETTVLLRRHTRLIRKLNRYWWWQIRTGSRRDQLSFNYVLWRLRAESHLGCIPGSRDNSPYFQWEWQISRARSVDLATR